MSANPDSIEKSFSERLTEFDSKIKAQEDNASLLNEIHASLTVLLAQSGDQDDEIREILQKRYNAGKLRLETYQLVRNVLDRVVIESMATMPDAADDKGDDEDSFRRTTVIAGSADEEDARQDHLQIGSVLRDRFLLQQRVSGGSMGVVYKAHDRRMAEADGFDPWVAIKVLSPKLSRNAHALRALQQEASKGRCLSHPNIVRFIDLDRDDDVYFIVMEWLEGRSLAAILDENKNRKIDLKTSLDIIRQVALALDYAHRCGVVHADVKPANIMLTPSGQVKLFDFGIARIRQKQHDSRDSFDPGVLGAVTPAYSSMQVLTGEDPVPADDVFSLGCLMYRLVAGHRVFGPRNAAEAAEQGMEPQRPQGLTDAQWRALKKSLAYSRVARFSTPAEFLQALEAEDGPTYAPPEQTFEPEFDGPVLVEPKPRPPEHRQYWGAAIVFLVLVAGALALVSQPDLFAKLQASIQSLFGSESSTIDIEDEPPAVTDAADEGESIAPSADEGSQDTQPAGTSGIAVDEQAPDDGLVDPFVADPDASPAEGPGEPLIEGPIGPDGQPAGPAAAETPTETAPADFSSLSPPTAIVPLATAGSFRAELDLTLREGSEDLVVDLVREGDIGDALSVRLEEISYSGNRSPWEAGRYQLSGNGLVTFSPGQERARMTISMRSDTVREPDGQATLLFRNMADPGSELAVVNLNLEDDDQRSFESGLPQDTVGFAVSRMYANERDPAVQIDVLRYNPSAGELDVRYFIGDGSATEGDDYFVPGASGLVFAPGQRSARLLIPLVQDSILEADETFALELLIDTDAPQANIFRGIEVIIRDDDG
ncbi:MAG TPA: protein kinase [Woeseiaceae bacterium]|nr:protein kinase [Woeseiaceae bacterium]